MGLLDKHLVYAEAHQADVAVGTEISPHVYLTQELAAGNAGVNLGMGKRIDGMIQVTKAFTSGGAATMLFQFVTSAAAALTTPNVHWSSPVTPKATLVLNYQIPFTLPHGITPAWLAYNGILFTAAGADFTDGEIDIWLAPEAGFSEDPGYANGMNIVP